MDIAFIGLGTMGRGLVRNLLGAGHTVTVWNRSQVDLPAELAAAKRAKTIAEALAGKKWVMVCVTGPDAQNAIYKDDDGVIAHLGKGVIIADVTTTAPEISVALASAVEMPENSGLIVGLVSQLDSAMPPSTSPPMPMSTIVRCAIVNFATRALSRASADVS